jgi:hypothetical protein
MQVKSSKETFNLSLKKKRFIAQKAYISCRRIREKIVSLTNLNKYLDYDTSENELNIHECANKGSEKL